MARYYLGEKDRNKFKRLVEDMTGRQRLHPTPQRRRRGGGGGGAGAIKIRFAITTVAIPAAVGYYDDDITPGIAVDGDEEPIDSIIVYPFGGAIGDPAPYATALAAKVENYAPAGIAIHKGIFVFERATGIWVAISEFCAAYGSSS